MKLLITGANGQLGSEIRALSTMSNHEFHFVGSRDCDINDLEQIQSVISEHNIEGIINCAAYTAVDQAEDNESKAFETNQFGVKNLNTSCEQANIPYIHISTDYVFDGTKRSPYKTTDQVSPIGVYGKSKRRGEEIVENSTTNAIVIRTSWLYSSYGNNFVKTMIRLGKERSELNVVNDQIGCPTYAKDLAVACITIVSQLKLKQAKQSIYHFSNNGEISWCDFAKEIMRQADIQCEVHPISTEEFPTKAERPKYSVLDNSEIMDHYNIEARNWKKSLQECLSKLDK